MVTSVFFMDSIPDSGPMIGVFVLLKCFAGSWNSHWLALPEVTVSPNRQACSSLLFRNQDKVRTPGRSRQYVGQSRIQRSIMPLRTGDIVIQSIDWLYPGACHYAVVPIQL